MAQLKFLVVFLGALGLVAATNVQNDVKNNILNTYGIQDDMESDAETAYEAVKQDRGDETNRAWPEATLAGVFTKSDGSDVDHELQGNEEMADAAVTTNRCPIRSLYTQIPGPVTLTHVSANINYVWAISSQQNIYICTRPCKGAWKHISGKLKQLDVDDQEIWGVNSGGAIYKRAVDGSGRWTGIRGRLKHVSASGHGYIWGTNNGDQIYKCKKPCRGAWVRVSGRLRQIDGGQKYVYGVNKANQIFSRPVDGSASWRHIPGRLKYVTASGIDDIYGINTHNNVFRCKKPCLGDFELLSGALNQCEATVDGLFGTTIAHGIYYRKF